MKLSSYLLCAAVAAPALVLFSSAIAAFAVASVSAILAVAVFDYGERQTVAASAILSEPKSALPLAA